MQQGDLYVTFIKDNTSIFLVYYNRNSASSMQLYISSEADLQLGKAELAASTCVIKSNSSEALVQFLSN